MTTWLRLATAVTGLTLLSACSGSSSPTATTTGHHTPAASPGTTQNVPGLEITTPADTPSPTQETTTPEPESRDDSTWPAVDRVALPPSVELPDGAGTQSLKGLQRFADDLAAGDFATVQQQCWTLSETALGSLFEHRDGVLSALQGRPEDNNPTFRWEVGEHSLFASISELQSSYSCPGLDTPYTTEDAMLLAVRVTRRMEQRPYRKVDTPLNYELECIPPAPEDADVVVEVEVMVEDTGGHYPDDVARAIRRVADSRTLASDSPRLGIFRVWDVARPDLKLVIGTDQGPPGCIIGADRG